MAGVDRGLWGVLACTASALGTAKRGPLNQWESFKSSSMIDTARVYDLCTGMVMISCSHSYVRSVLTFLVATDDQH